GGPAPAVSSWTTSALPQSTRHTALRKPTVVSGSYVTLSNSTRRTAPPAGAGRLSEPHAPSVSPGTRIRHHISVQVAGDHRVPDMSRTDSGEHGAAGLGYPAARRLELTEDILGYRVSDPYRWLEDDTSAERSGWLAEEAALFGSYREELPGRDRLAAQVRELLGTGYAGTPAWRGE